MDNGMLNPVMIYKGGYRCIHSWLAVDPKWDGVPKPEQGSHYTVEEHGRTITVFGSRAEVIRLNKQIELGSGYQLFFNAESNRKGFTAIHRSWWEKYSHTSKRQREAMALELEIGKKLAEFGHTVQFTLLEKKSAGRSGGCDHQRKGV